MKRTFQHTLEGWRAQPNRKPLLVRGARQVGKTWLLNHFGDTAFERTVCLDFAANEDLKKLFSPNLDPKRIITDLGIFLGESIALDRTLLIFDEIQHCPAALTALKYLQSAYPSAFICASGSLLGLGLSEQDFPVGKVQRAHLYPMTYFEFLDALGENALANHLQQAGEHTVALSPLIHSKSFGYFKEYLITGGLPEVVAHYIEQRDTRAEAYTAARVRQRELINDYLDDIAKHAGKINAMHIAAIFRNIPHQLARETSGISKYRFKDVLAGRSTYDVLASPIEWLIRAGLAHRVPICRKVRHPLAAYAEHNAFMLYLFDVGILGAMLNLDPAALYLYDIGQIKGFLAENMVLNELVAAGWHDIYTWRGKTSEIEFVLPVGDEAIPVEVKSGLNAKARSMQSYRDRYAPPLAALFSAQGTNQIDNGLLHAPLYLAGATPFKR